MFNLKKLIFLSVLVSLNASAFSISEFENLQVNFGTWQENYNQVQESSNGELNGFEIRPYLSVGVDYNIYDEFGFIPEVGYILRENIGDSSVTKDIFYLRGDFTYAPKEWLRLRLGTSLMWMTISGDGSEEDLANGNGEETYYAPNERRNIFNQTLDFGVEYIHKKTSLRLQNYMYAVTDSDQRISSISLSVNYQIPVSEL